MDFWMWVLVVYGVGFVIGLIVAGYKDPTFTQPTILLSFFWPFLAPAMLGAWLANKKKER